MEKWKERRMREGKEKECIEIISKSLNYCINVC